MAMWTVIAKNDSGSVQTIADMGLSIADSAQFDLSESFTYDEIAGSDDLRTLVAADDITINDGSSDLSVAEGGLYLTLVHQKYLADNHYTETEMQTSGQSQMHWDNITNKPSFGSVAWLDPVLARVLEIDQGTPPAGTQGDFYIDDQATPHLWWYDSAAWNDQGAVSTGDRFIDLNDADESIYEWSGSAWTDEGVNSDNDGVMVDDDGDGKQSQYVYDTTGTTWTKIGDVDFGGHLDGGSNKHDANEIDVEGTYTNLPTSDLETVIAAIDSDLTSALDHNTLDEAYDEGGAGTGRTITTDNGAVKLDPASGGYAPLEIVPTAAHPSNDLQDGQVCVVGGIMYIYDSTRTLWISVQRMLLTFGREGKTKDQYLGFGGAGDFPSNLSGVRLIRDAVITGISCQLETTGTCTASIRKNDSATDLLSLNVSGTIGADNAAANLATLVDGDYLQCYLAATTKVDDPLVMIELGWRIAPL